VQKVELKAEERGLPAVDEAPNAWKHEIREGWLILVTSLFGIAVGAASMLFYSLGMFFEPLQREFGWTRGQVSGALLYLTLGFVISGPIVGWLSDRYGARVVALISIPLLAVSLFSLLRVGNSLPSFYALFFAAGSLGGGTTPVVYTRVVNANFKSSRGLALGIVLAGTGIAALALPPALGAAIGAWGWRDGFMVLAIAAGWAWPFVLYALRNVQGAAPPETRVHGVDRMTALTSRVFWTVSIAFVAVAMAVSAFVVHLVPLLCDGGMTLPRAAAVASIIGIGVILGRVLIGWTIDRLFAPYVAAVVFLITAIGCVLLDLAGADAAPISAFAVGLALGAEIDLIAYLTARYFGMRNYGFLYGSIYSMFSVGAAAGPVIVGYLFDWYGSYNLSLWIMASCLLFGALMIAPLPQFDWLRR